jgi:hypothetical protein
VLNFDQICVDDAEGTHDKLVDEAKLRPRTLFRMAHEILSEFQRRSSKKDYKIDASSIEYGINAGLESVHG